MCERYHRLWNLLQEGRKSSRSFCGCWLVKWHTIKVHKWRAPKSLVRPTWGSKYVELRKVGTRGLLPTSSIKKGVEGRARSPEIRLGRGTSIISLESASKTKHKRVSSHSGTPLGVGTSHRHFDTLDSPRPGLGGSHHLPPYSILCSSLWRLHHTS